MDFDPTDALMGLIGGGLIGLAGAVLLLSLGRIAGISGIAAALLRGPRDRSFARNAAFVAGLVAAPVGYGFVAGAPAITITSNIPVLIGAGILVGLGTRIGGGCTSGHGVCGLSRFSLRSIMATGVFMAVAVVVASVAPMLTGGQP